MKRFTSFGTFIIVIFLTTSLFASGVALTGIGARATALGGNFRAIASDWSAMFWNPAGIAQIKGFHVGGSFELIMPGAKYMLAQNLPPFSVYRTTEFENEPKTFPIPAAGFVYGTEKMSFGLSFFAPFGLGSKWDAMNTNAYNSAYPEFEFEDDLQVIDIHPTFAYQINEKLSVGVGFSFTLSDILIRKPTTTPNPLIFEPQLEPLRGILTQNQLGSLLSSNFNHILTDTELKGDGTNFGFNFGLKYNINEDLSFGISGNYYNDVSLDGKINANTYGAVISQAEFTGYKGILDQMLAGGLLPSDQYQQLLGIYSGQKIPKYTDEKGDATLPLPMTIGGGFAFTGVENLLISADVSWTQWSSWDLIEIDLENGDKIELVEKWDDAIRFGLGLEYKVMDPLKLRAGYYTEPGVIPDQTLTITIPDINRRHAVSLGASYCVGSLNLFASYEKILIGDRTVDAPWNYNAASLGYDNMAGTYKMDVNNIMFGLGVNF